MPPGTNTLVLGFVEAHPPQARFVHAELVRTRHGDPAAARIGVIYEAVTSAIANHRPEALAVEAQFFYRQNELAYKVGWAMGAVFLAAGQAGLEVFQYGPMEVKRALVGTGHADKRQVAFMVRALLGLKRAPESSHAADALAVALTHLAHLRTGTTPRV
ncbi:crossover junction endodeoxyribonuclease RuvC [Oceanithermus sp.]